MTAVLVDTSVWVEYLRATGSRACRELHRLLRDAPTTVSTTEPIIMEVLAGATSPQALAALELVVNGLQRLQIDPAVDFHAAASAYRAARLSGRTVRKLPDCLIAVIAQRHAVALLHRDADFDVLAEVLPGLTVRSFVAEAGAQG